MCADAQRGLRAVCASHTNALSRLSSFSNHPKLQAIGVGAKLMPEYKKKERKFFLKKITHQLEHHS